MKRQYVILILVVVLLGLLIAWFVNKTEWKQITVPSPLRGEAATNPFYSAQHLVDALGGASEWRHSLGTIAHNDSVLVLTYWNWSLIESRRLQIEAWVNAGGRLLIDRTLIGGDKELKAWTGIARKLPKKKAIGDDEEDADSDEAANDPPQKNKDKSVVPLRRIDAGVCTKLEPEHTDTADSANQTRAYTVCNLTDHSWLTSAKQPTWALHDKYGLQAVRIAVGKGSVTVINANPFGNRDLLELDHAVLFATATQLHRGDHVVFLSEEQQTSILGLIWQHAAAVVLLFALLIAAILWRGAVRFGPLAATPDVARRSLAEQIVGSGWFTLRLGGFKALHASMVRAVNESAQRRIPNYSLLSNDERVSKLAHLANVDKDKLAAALRLADLNNRVDARKAIALLEFTRRTLISIEVSHAS